MTHRAFTLIEMLVVITVMAVLAVIVAPMVNDETRLQLVAASSIITSDIELAEVMSITSPDRPVVVRFDAPANAYWLALAATPETPILRGGTGEPYRVVLGEGRASGARGVRFTLSDLPADTLTFNATGGLAAFSTTPIISLQCNGKAIELHISPNTGTITQVVPSGGTKKGGGKGK